MFMFDHSHDRFQTLSNQMESESLFEQLETIPLRSLHEKLADSRVIEEAELYGSLYKAKARTMAENRNELFMVSIDQTVDCIIGGVRSNTPSWVDQHVKKLEGFTNEIEPKLWPFGVPAGLLDRAPEKMRGVKQLLKMIGVN